MILFADYNTPYLFAISFVLLIGLLEIFALICGHMLSGALDAHLDHYDSITTGHISRALHYLNIGRLPALVVLCLLAGFLVLLASCCSMPASWSGNHHCRTCSWFLSVYCLRLLRCIIPVKQLRLDSTRPQFSYYRRRIYWQHGVNYRSSSHFR